MFDLKKLSKDGVAAALAKAERYRLLNEPLEAESICLDVLEIESDNQEALVTLTLAYTDQLDHQSQAARKAQETAARLASDYDKHYYAGIICERRGKAALTRSGLGREFDAYEWFRDAMERFEKAEALRPAGNDDAILRWNACARIIMAQNLKPREADNFIPLLE